MSQSSKEQERSQQNKEGPRSQEEDKKSQEESQKGQEDGQQSHQEVDDDDDDEDEGIILYEELRLIERNEDEINKCWRNLFLILFVLIFIFGTSCTFCINLLMYVFDDQCILYPRILSLSDQRQSVIYDYIPGKMIMKTLPVEFVNSQWNDSKACYLPQFVPLFSAICGLIWFAMFWMCSSDYQVLSGLQHPYRVFPALFMGSSIMAGLCLHTSTNTLHGLWEFCNKLSEVFGDTRCSYAMSLVALAFDKTSEGVYDAVVMTILTSWMSTLCWVLISLLVMIRVIFIVDFTLVRITVELRGDVTKMLDFKESELETIYPSDEALRVQKMDQNEKMDKRDIHFDKYTTKDGETETKDEEPRNISKTSMTKSTDKSNDIDELSKASDTKDIYKISDSDWAQKNSNIKSVSQATNTNEFSEDAHTAASATHEAHEKLLKSLNEKFLQMENKLKQLSRTNIPNETRKEESKTVTSTETRTEKPERVSESREPKPSKSVGRMLSRTKFPPFPLSRSQPIMVPLERRLKTSPKNNDSQNSQPTNASEPSTSQNTERGMEKRVRMADTVSISSYEDDDDDKADKDKDKNIIDTKAKDDKKEEIDKKEIDKKSKRK